MKKKLKRLQWWLFRKLFKQQLEYFEQTAAQLASEQKKLQYIYDQIGVGVDLDTHLGPRNESWAVISLRGEKSDMVRFIDLSGRNPQEIEDFLRVFNRSRDRNIHIDAPMGYKGIMKRSLKINRF